MEKNTDKTPYAELPSTARHVNFRMPVDLVEKLVLLGIIPEEFDRKTLSNSVLEFFKKYADSQIPTVEPEDAINMAKSLRTIEAKLHQLEGKFPPQAA